MIAVFEDHVEQRQRLADTIRAMGKVPFSVDTPPALADIGTFIAEHQITGVISDHRLNERHYSDYLGAQVARTFYDYRVGTVLLTSYTQSDANTTLRIHRRWLPCVIDPNELSNPRLELEAALARADAEARQGLLPSEREPFRTLMTVTSSGIIGNRHMVKVLMGQWKSDVEVSFPLEMIPERMRHVIRPKALLVARVNLDADRAEDLYFEDFELPDSDAFRESQAFFDHP